MDKSMIVEVPSFMHTFMNKDIKIFLCNKRSNKFSTVTIKMQIHIMSLGISYFNGLRMHITHIVQYCAIMISSIMHVLYIILRILCTSNINRKLQDKVNDII